MCTGGRYYLYYESRSPSLTLSRIFYPMGPKKPLPSCCEGSMAYNGTFGYVSHPTTTSLGCKRWFQYIRAFRPLLPSTLLSTQAITCT